MSSRDLSVRSARWLLLAAIYVVAANMRVSIAGVGPLVEQIRADTGISVPGMGFLASVPLLLWALVSPFAHAVSRRVGLSATMFWSLIILTAGTAIRSVIPMEWGLWVGTILIGLALALANVLMPAVVKRDFPDRAAGVTGIYTALMVGVGALVSGFVVPISQIEIGGAEAGWRIALLASGALLPLAIILWVVAERPGFRGVDTDPEAVPVQPRHASGRRRTVWTDRVAWLVAAYMGLQAVQFYMFVTWLSPMSISFGNSETQAGFEVMLLQIFGIPGSLLLPFLLRSKIGPWVPALLPLISVVAGIGLLVAPQLLPLWVCAMSVSGGATLAMALTYITERAGDHSTASALSGMSQGVGYVIAAIGPVVFGWLHEVTGGWESSIILMLATLLGLALIGILLKGRGKVFGER